MKEKTNKIFKWTYSLILAVCCIGLALVLIGLVFKNDPLYFCGLILASPFFVIVLPCCILLVVLFMCGAFYVIIGNLFSLLNKFINGDNGQVASTNLEKADKIKKS